MHDENDDDLVNFYPSGCHVKLGPGHPRQPKEGRRLIEIFHLHIRVIRIMGMVERRMMMTWMRRMKLARVREMSMRGW